MGILSKIFKSDDQVERKPKATETSSTKVAVGQTADKPAAAVPLKVKADPNAFRYLSMPLITEKATDLAMFNKYCFIVPKSANKTEVGKAVMNIYGARPIKINFVQRPGKAVRHGKISGLTKAYKKAIITLKAGEKIELYEGV